MSELITELEITSLVHGGRGIGRFAGKAVFVPLTVPGDRITCKVVRSKKRYAEAELVAVTEPSPSRREPPCPYFGVCGGCQWQHLPYTEQVWWKEQLFADQLIRNEILAAGRMGSIVAAPDEWHYRNRAQFKCCYTSAGLDIGFYRHGSHSVVDVTHCMLLAPRLKETFDWLRNELPSAPMLECLRQVDVAVGDDECVRVVLHVSQQAREQFRGWLLKFALRHQVHAFLQAGHREMAELVYGELMLKIAVDQPEMMLGYGPGGFAQVNSVQNRAMVDAMVAILELSGTEQVLDLFCGMGNFSLPLARRAARVVGVENYAPSIDSARNNARINQISNAEFHAADVTAVMQSGLMKEVDLVVLDPPRSGHYPVAEQLLLFKPQRILYVSCDPATLARDLKPLVRGGYKVAWSRPFDLFPQTWHIESMTLLTKR